MCSCSFLQCLQLGVLTVFGFLGACACVVLHGLASLREVPLPYAVPLASSQAPSPCASASGVWPGVCFFCDQGSSYSVVRRHSHVLLLRQLRLRQGDSLRRGIPFLYRRETRGFLKETGEHLRRPSWFDRLGTVSAALEFSTVTASSVMLLVAATSSLGSSIPAAAASFRQKAFVTSSTTVPPFPNLGALAIVLRPAFGSSP